VDRIHRILVNRAKKLYTDDTYLFYAYKLRLLFFLDMFMEIGTSTKSASVSKIKMATALLLLGGAALAASAAGGLAGRGMRSSVPDLAIRKIIFEPANPDQGKGQPYFGMYNDTVTVYYSNIGGATVNKPFKLAIRLGPAPYTVSKPVTYLSTNGAAYPSGYSGGFYEFTTIQAEKISETIYAANADSATGVSDIITNLNKYALKPGETGRVTFYVPPYFKEMLKSGQKLGILSKVDFVKTNTNGVIKESNEKNNQATIYVDSSKLADVDAQLCDKTDYITQGFCSSINKPFACLDKFGSGLIGCTDTAEECEGKSVAAMACSTGPLGQPELSSVKLMIGDWETVVDPNSAQSNAVSVFYPKEYKSIAKKIGINVSVNNMSAGTNIGYYLDTAGMTYYPNDSADYYKDNIVPKFTWGDYFLFASTVNQDIFKVHVSVDNGDNEYKNFPNTQLDDALLIMLYPESDYTEPTSTSPTGPTTSTAPSFEVVSSQQGGILINGKQTLGAYTFVTAANSEEDYCVESFKLSVTADVNTKLSNFEIVESATGEIKTVVPPAAEQMVQLSNFCIPAGSSKELRIRTYVTTPEVGGYFTSKISNVTFLGADSNWKSTYLVEVLGATFVN